MKKYSVIRLKYIFCFVFTVKRKLKINILQISRDNSSVSIAFILNIVRYLNIFHILKGILERLVQEENICL